ncbi:uncharacterized protein K489DRAFT_411201 [Dissoconium aciculare CBS 342.82]|uniref:Uncharacterized protein n=1 Tax=Dissoconium aciculare CBS 342.82 TaxID=1314786 RepID=A0A6J3M189_9PEZI|nr:uncharacterized protein K489DRAFT_411201 [Dissoconium aciculare CBS 342.82]KAF1821786.1 hypothetical protein K489DRAFT_411201 [Dissoconium aciculare CBS 342.82]
MFNSLQGKRPQSQQPQSNSPLFQQQVRNLDTRVASKPAPRSQIEAMPPNQTSTIAPTPDTKDRSSSPASKLAAASATIKWQPPSFGSSNSRGPQIGPIDHVFKNSRSPKL